MNYDNVKTYISLQIHDLISITFYIENDAVNVSVVLYM